MWHKGLLAAIRLLILLSDGDQRAQQRLPDVLQRTTQSRNGLAKPGHPLADDPPAVSGVHPATQAVRRQHCGGAKKLVNNLVSRYLVVTSYCVVSDLRVRCNPRFWPKNAL